MEPSEGAESLPLHLEAWRLLLQTHAALVHRLEQDLQERCDLPLSWYEVLLHLARARGGRLRMQEVASRALLTKSGVSRLIDRMEEEGLVRREQCPSDQRGAYAVLTPLGRSTLRRAAPVHLRGIREHFARHLSDADAAAVQRILGKLLASLHPDAGEAPGPLCADELADERPSQSHP